MYWLRFPLILLQERDLIVYADFMLDSELSDFLDFPIETSLSDSESESELCLILDANLLI